jgi:hypothetical protein
MPVLGPKEKRWVVLLGVLIWINASVFFAFMYTTIHYDNISPTAADESSGHIYPRYDKIHGRFVYLDKTAKDSELRFAWILGSLALCAAIVGLKVNSLYKHQVMPKRAAPWNHRWGP